MARNLPGVAAQEPEEEDDFNFDGDDEEFDTDDDELEDDEEDDEDGDDEDELDEKTQAIIARREQEITNRVKEQLRAKGFDLSDDFQPVIRDPKAAQGFLGHLPPQQAAPPPVQQQAPPEDEKDDPMPDADIDGAAAVQAWFQRQTAKAVKAAVAPLVAELQVTRQGVLNRDARDATRTAARLLQDEGFEDAARHPKFQEVFQSFLSRVDPEQWSDPDNLLRLGLMCLPDLKGGTPKASADKARLRARQEASRGLLSQANPSKGTTAALRQSTQADPTDVAVAKRLGMSVAEYTALKDPSGEAYERWKAKERAKAKGGKK